ncbi:MAG: cation transporter [Lewinellaceae bacterium]|nr:cation transporter [Lewinellaceae bacterium]
MEKTIFRIPGMDCPSEEQLIRLKLEPVKAVQFLQFDLAGRKLTVYHENGLPVIEQSLAGLKLGAERLSSQPAEALPEGEKPEAESRLLWMVLAINGAFFMVEMTTGLISGSMGLVADSLDMLADAIVYGLSLWAVGKAYTSKQKVATISGYFQLALALLGIVETVRRFLGHGETPVFQVMIAVSLFALAGNAASLWLLNRSKSGEAHIQASKIFTSNDVVINIGVIIAGVLVYLTSSRLPDLVVGSIVFLIVIRGAFKILKLAR